MKKKLEDILDDINDVYTDYAPLLGIVAGALLVITAFVWFYAEAIEAPWFSGWYAPVLVFNGAAFAVTMLALANVWTFARYQHFWYLLSVAGIFGPFVMTAMKSWPMIYSARTVPVWAYFWLVITSCTVETVLKNIHQKSPPQPASQSS